MFCLVFTVSFRTGCHKVNHEPSLCRSAKKKGHNFQGETAARQAQRHTNRHYFRIFAVSLA